MLAALHATPWSSLGKRVGLVWLDTHADFNTPEIDPWGFLDGQGLAMTVDSDRHARRGLYLALGLNEGASLIGWRSTRTSPSGLPRRILM
jgi:arginase family enzyme